MAVEEVTREELTEKLQQVNRELVKLREHPQSFASEIYDLPDNPTPNHIERMRDDLSALADDASQDDCPDAVWTYFDNTITYLQDLQTLLYRASAPPDPFNEYR